MVTKKDYKAIAKAIYQNEESTPHLEDITDRLFHRSLVEDLADYFATDDPRFNRDKFLKACGLGD
ncbi:hypothetical protein LCGC14_0437530 [marine sediment metagenome]|uniref:Uncharacterized protein n=1 Tax=marine sediment metagenome TaxID=412755 RepID=A0A0F9T4Q1_9ZZZZ